MNNLEKLATLSTQDTGRRQTLKKKQSTENSKQTTMNNKDPIKHGVWTLVLVRGVNPGDREGCEPWGSRGVWTLGIARGVNTGVREG